MAIVVTPKNISRLTQLADEENLEATVIATVTLADGQTYDAIIIYEKGAALAVPPTDGSGPVAADIRIGMFFHYFAHDVLNENAYALIEAAVILLLIENSCIFQSESTLCPINDIYERLYVVKRKDSCTEKISSLPAG